MEHWSKRLSRTIKQRGWDYPELAARSGVSVESIRKYAQGGVDNPRGNIPNNLAKALGVSVIWLMHNEGSPEDEHIGNTPDLPEREDSGETVRVPEYDVRASMGDGFVVDRETVKGKWTFSRSYLVDELRLDLRGLVVIEVIGDSMEPTLKSGDRVLVDTSDRRIGIPGVFVLWDGDGTVAKRIEVVPNSKPQKIMRISDNPQHGRYEVLAGETNIIGRIVWFARRL